MSVEQLPVQNISTEPRRPARTLPVALEDLTTLLKLLSDPTRLSILMHLSVGERNVSSLCDHLQLPQPTVSHHLGLLRASNVICNRRDGKQVFYSLGAKIDRAQLEEICLTSDAYTVRISPRPRPS